MITSQLIKVGRELADELRPLMFTDPVTHTYLTVDYARAGYEAYLETYANSKKRTLLLGMNPGPFGMAQTGVPFGEIAAVRDWMKLSPEIGKPDNEHPKRKITGMACEKSEVSGNYGNACHHFRQRSGRHSFFRFTKNTARFGHR